MKVLTEMRGGKTILTLKEERLDAHNSGELKDRILKLFEDGCRAVVVDLRNVQFSDSAGLGALLSGHKNAAQLSFMPTGRLNSSAAARKSSCSSA
jgi:anti-sigma B factor antagonist